MSFWERIRVLLLSATGISTLIVLANISFSSTLGKNSFSEYTLPQTVALPDWQFLKSKDLPKTPPEELSRNDAIPSAKRYQFTQHKLSLELESHYVMHTDGNLNRLIERYKKIPISSMNPSASIRTKSGVGFYGLSSFRNQTYLDACINQRPGSTFTQAQFMANQTSYRMHPQQIIALLWGQERLNDHRCLWVHLALPMDKTSPKSTEAMLEKAWFSLYPQLHAHFSKSSG
jgi:cyanosortase A-associated protein